jgi:hypothetical protein
MSILCRLSGHTAHGTVKWNNGHYFSRCSRCASDILRQSDGRWRKPPKNARVVWKPREPHDIDWEAWQRRQQTSPRQGMHLTAD